MKLFLDQDDRKEKKSSSSIFHSTFNVTSLLYGRRSSQMTTSRMTSTEKKIDQANEKDKHLTKRKTDGNDDRKAKAKKNKNNKHGKRNNKRNCKKKKKHCKTENNTIMPYDNERKIISNASTKTPMSPKSTNRPYTITTVSSNLNLTPISTVHSNSKMGRNGTSHTEQNVSTTTPYSITPNVTDNLTIFSETSTTVVQLSTTNSSTLSSSQPNITHASEINGIPTQSHIQTDLVNSTTANIDPSGLSTLSSTEKGIGRSISDEMSTQQSGQKHKTFDTTYQFPNTTMSHESREENIPNPFTSNIGKLVLYTIL